MKIAYLHNLPLEYYPPAGNFLDILGKQVVAEVRVFTIQNRKGRPIYQNSAIDIQRSRAPDPDAFRLMRLFQAARWHLRTAISLRRFKPDVLIYVEPHSAIAAWVYFRLLRGKSRLFIHHHEYYEPGDYRRPGMNLPRLGARFEQEYLFSKAEWISQTNRDRLRLASANNPGVSPDSWQITPNYPPKAWGSTQKNHKKCGRDGSPLRVIYVGSASFSDTYIENIVKWAAKNPAAVELHICGYNVSTDVWDWLESQDFSNVSHNRGGLEYDELPTLLEDFDVGLVLYKGNTTNFIFNVPNKVFEYLRCGLEVWYPEEMKGIDTFITGRNLPLRKIDFSKMSEVTPAMLDREDEDSSDSNFTAERAFAPLLARLGLGTIRGAAEVMAPEA